MLETDSSSVGLIFFFLTTGAFFFSSFSSVNSGWSGYCTHLFDLYLALSLGLKAVHRVFLHIHSCASKSSQSNHNVLGRIKVAELNRFLRKKDLSSRYNGISRALPWREGEFSSVSRTPLLLQHQNQLPGAILEKVAAEWNKKASSCETIGPSSLTVVGSSSPGF